MTVLRLSLIAAFALTLTGCHTIGHVPPGQAKHVVAPPPGQAKKLDRH